MLLEDIKNNYNTIIFDNDGVILDSNQAKTEAFSKSVEGYEINKIREFLDYHTANGGISRFEKFDHFYRNILKIENYQEQSKKSLDIFAHLAKKALLEAEEMDGVLDFIKNIYKSDKLIYVISASDQEELIDVYTDRDIGKYFDRILGSPVSKEYHLERLLDSNQISYPALYFGDSSTDFILAKKHELDFVFISSKSEWMEGEDICKAANCRIIEDFNEIL
jgi:phosphoglycolate phosphatase-like HAD superfamily hydrolase